MLAGEEKLALQPNHAPGRRGALLEALRRRYNFIVVDVPFAPVPLYRDLLDLVDQRVLVMEPTLAGGARHAAAAGAAERATGRRSAPVVVLNRVGVPGGLTRRQVEEALKMKVDVVIPDLPRQVGSAATLGEPAMASSSGFRNGILELARQVAWSRLLDGGPDAAAAPQRPVTSDRAGSCSAAPLMSATFRTELRPPQSRVGPRAPTPPRPRPVADRLRPNGSRRLPGCHRGDRRTARRLPGAARPDRGRRRCQPSGSTVDVERLISEIATERRIQLNGREQRELAGELVQDMLGLGPLEPLLEDDSITDIMVNGPTGCSSSAAARSCWPNIRFRDHGAPRQHLPAHRRRGRPARR